MLLIEKNNKVLQNWCERNCPSEDELSRRKLLAASVIEKWSKEVPVDKTLLEKIPLTISEEQTSAEEFPYVLFHFANEIFSKKEELLYSMEDVSVKDIVVRYAKPEVLQPDGSTKVFANFTIAFEKKKKG